MRPLKRTDSVRVAFPLRNSRFLLFFATAFFLSFFLSFVTEAEAITLNKSGYFEGEEILTTSGGAAAILYNITSDAPMILKFGYEANWDVNRNDFGDLVLTESRYVIMEHTSPDIPCYQSQQSIDECRQAPEFINEFFFSVELPPPPPDGGGSSTDEVPNTPSAGTPQYGPSISIFSPKVGTIFSHLGTISYTATDRNDQGNQSERDVYGLLKTPVTLYYSDKIAEWYSGGASIAPDLKTLIAEKQPAEASYSWSITDLIPGVFYRIIANVIDAAGTSGETVSDFFTVDFTAPTFITRANPPATQGKDVTISVDVSENLQEAPTITVTQAGGKAVSLVMTGQGSHYEGTYIISKGYDGVANVTVSGTDVAGNVGTTIVSGGTFAVGINPPPAPSVVSPQNNVVVGTSMVAVAGTLPRSDTVAVLLVNGIDTYVASSTQNGVFTISNIRLSKDTNHGLNVLSVRARDQTGLMSEAMPIQIKYNIAPTVAISLPTDKAIVSATVALTARAGDENTDPLLFTYQIIPAQDFDATVAATSTKNEWNIIGDALPAPSFSWDSTEVEDGQYFLRVMADDGFAKTYSNPTPFSIHNTLPFFRFEDGRKTITNLSTAAIVGRAITPSAISPQPTVKTVEYSLDNGNKWKLVPLISGSGTPEVRFSVTFTDLREGTQGILWRAKDSRNLSGRTSHPVIVDTKAPFAPIVNSPANNTLVSNNKDENASKEGLQISISGTAEPQSVVILQNESTTLTEKVRVDGSFIFRAVDVPHRGTNQFKIIARDEALNTSIASIVNVVYDNPPTVSILAPKPFRGLMGKATVSWRITDADNDSIKNVTLGYRRGHEAYKLLPIDQAKNSFAFDASAFPEANDYQLRLAANDGMATGTDTVNFSVDRTPPVLSSFTLGASVLGEGDVLLGRGMAQDSLSGIEYVEYAVTQDKNPASFSTALLTSGFLQENATFTLKYPTKIEDGTYTVYVRAVDAAGNVSPMLSRIVTVDASPPRIGSFDVMAQEVRIVPDARGAISLYKGMKTLFEVSLEGDTNSASLTLGSTTIPLEKDIVSGLWQATVDSGSTGTTTIYISAEDKTRNVLIRTPIGSFVAIKYGVVTTSIPDGNTEPLSGASIKVLVLDERTGNSIPFSSSSVITSDVQGQYSLALPQGMYELSVNKSGYRSVVQKIVLERAGFVNVSFSAEKFGGAWEFIQRIIDYLFS